MAVTARATGSAATLDVARIRQDFPVLSQTVHGKPLVWLDSASTSQKPRQVLEAMRVVYEEHNANIHRGVYEFSERTTAAFEDARAAVARFINAPSPREVIFVRNATEGLNLVAYAWGRDNLRKGDRVVTTVLEHHSSFVPWQQLAQDVGAELVVVDIDDDGRLRLDQMRAELEKGAKVLAITHTSNGLGVIDPVKEVVGWAKRAGATTIVDAAQSAPHMRVDVQDIGCDFIAFSGHKMLGPVGSGVVWGRAALLERMRPFLYGGDMISRVSIERSDWNELPWKFEAGTSAYVDAIGLGAAVRYLEEVGIDAIHRHEVALVAHLLPPLLAEDGVTVFGPHDTRDRVGVVSFDVKGIHPHDMATLLDREGIAVRAGHHCNNPLMTRLGVSATTRASTYLYNTNEEMDALVAAVRKAKKVFGL
ncbi:MAG: cysteine desulfurase [Chloroflexota bacterium]|nr:cysteine desulfurase [Chloroflexota bacterium]MDE3192329.1 cysteine desulfurase [Chloroflexota bacterium]